MNSCDYYQELISRLVDGEISQDEHEALMAHLNTCSRCNAMYAVFHDLSDILAEEPEALPEGLHENIMAGVRRSEIIRKNRRLRKIGLRTALTAAACAVLVLFAAAGFGPGKRAESVSIRSEEEARQILPSPTPDSYRTEAPAAPAAVEYAFPVQSAAPVPVPTWAPVSEAAPASPDVYLAADNDAQYTAPQPTQYVYVQPVQTPGPAVYQASESAVYQTPEPVIYQTPEPVIYQTPIQAQPAEPVQTAEPALPQRQDYNAVQNEVPALTKRAAPMAALEAVPATEAAGVQSTGSVPETEAPEAVAESASEIMEYEETVFSSFSSMYSMSAGNAQDTLTEAETADMPETESFSVNALMMGSAPSEAEETESAMEAALYADAEEEIAANAAPAETNAPVSVENVSVRGKESRARFLAMIGQTESELPSEAELTRLVHVTLIPEDEYASEEKMDISIYGDFIYCKYYRADGSSVICRADCSLRSLDDFLKECRAAEAAVTPAPTADPYAAVTPQP